MAKTSYFLQASGSSFWLQLAERLSFDFRLSLAVLDDRIASDFSSRLPDAQILLGNDLKYGLFDRESCSPVPAHVRQSFHYLKREREAIYALERAGVGGEVDFPDRLLLLSSMGDYFWGLFEKHQPAFGLATEAPHTFPELMMHAVAEARQIPILHFQQNGIMPSVRPVIGPKYQRVAVTASLSADRNRCRRENLERFRESVDSFLAGARQDQLVGYELDFQARDRRTFSGPKAYWRRFYIPYAWLSEEVEQTRSFLQRNPSLQPDTLTPTHPIVLLGSRFRLVGASIRLAVLQGRALRRLRKALEDRSRNEVPNRYGAFFLQFEPEKTSVPDGGYFQDQLAAVRRVASSLEGHMKLLVREHPSQLTLIARGFRVRRARFYEELARIPNVVLVGREVDRETLLRGAAVVFTLTGSIGLEARARGIPVVALGYPWYIPLSGVFSPSADGCLVEAIDSALSWSASQEEDFADELWRLILSDSFVTLLNPSAARRFPDVEDDIAALTDLVAATFGSAPTGVS